MTRPPLLALSLAALLAPASAQPHAPHPDVRVVDCDPAGPATAASGAVCAGEPRADRPSADRALDPATAAVSRLYAYMAQGEVGAVAAVLDDHVMWSGPDGRLVGRVAVAARLAALALPTPEAVRLDAPGRVVAVSRRPDGGAVRTVWYVADGRVTGIEHPAALPRSHARDL